MDTKTCNDCKHELPLESFASRGGTRRNGKCRYCHNRYTKGHYERNKALYKQRAKINDKRYQENYREFLSWLKSIPCTDCGRSFDPFCMDFDHLGDKTFAISEGVTRSFAPERMMEELAKCEVVCACCHRLRTKLRLTVQSA